MNAMLDQIYSLPALIRESVQPFDESVRKALDHRLCLSMKRLYLTGCGDSHHAAVGTELAFEALAGIPTEAQTALQFARYAAQYLPQSGPDTNVVIGISVSGEVSRTLEALQQAKKNGAVAIALSATPGSRVYEAGEKVIDSKTVTPYADPPGIHVPGVRSFTANQLALLLGALRIGEVRGNLTTAEANDLRQELASLADAVEESIQLSDKAARSLAEAWEDAQEYVFVGGGPNYATAMFSAAKLLEATGDAAMAQETEEWAHLQYFAKVENTPTFLISAGGRDLSRMNEVSVAAKQIGRRTAAIAPQSASPLVQTTDFVLPFAGVREMFSPLVACIPGELFAAHRSALIGEPYFRGFGGGRSQEGGGGISRIRTSDVME